MSTLGSSPTVPKKHRVLIVDDHPIVRRGLTELISQEPDLEVCGEAADTAEALALLETVYPDAAIIDISLKSGHGLELIAQIKAKNENIRMLVSSMHDELLFAERALRAGALGYLPKQEPIEKLIEALRQVLRGEIYLSPRMANRMMHVLIGQSVDGDPIKSLSNRELEVFEMIGQGMTTQNIARKLELSAKTIETHREKIKSKLNLKNSAELNRRAVQWVLENS
ncbi:MAG: response regulator transcription factor [Pirellulales bacterium]|nr:response regulator transcription factor [Pirellulales bacterium]